MIGVFDLRNWTFSRFLFFVWVSLNKYTQTSTNAHVFTRPYKYVHAGANLGYYLTGSKTK
jgi:hypothetical protein